jgi:large subunit ribosomal protein L6
MSRIGKKTIPLPPGVTVEVSGSVVTVKGPKGSLSRVLHETIGVDRADGSIGITPRRHTKKTAALWGLTRALVANMVEGVARGFEKKLDFEGIGYRAVLEGTTLVLQLGFSHPVRIGAPVGIVFSVERNTITIAGVDCELVGQTSARREKVFAIAVRLFAARPGRKRPRERKRHPPIPFL